MLNQITLIGRLGRDPDLRTIKGHHRCRLSVVTVLRWNDKNGVRQEQTQWHDVIAWGRDAENCAQYLQKGALVAIVGRLEYRTYRPNKDAEEKRVAEIRVLTVQFLDYSGDRTDD